MFKLEITRLQLAEKVFNWKKATMDDVAKQLHSSIDELKELSDDDFIGMLFLYSNIYCEVS